MNNETEFSKEEIINTLKHQINAQNTFSSWSIELSEPLCRKIIALLESSVEKDEVITVIDNLSNFSYQFESQLLEDIKTSIKNM